MLLKKKQIGQQKADGEIQPNDIHSPYRGVFNGIVTYEDKIKGVYDNLSQLKEVKKYPIIKQEYPSYFYRVAVFVNQYNHYSSALYSYSSKEHKRDFAIRDLTTMRNDALAYYYERINANNQNGMNPVSDHYNHFPLSKYKSQNSNTIAIALYLVKYWGDERYSEYLIGGDEQEYLEEGRAFEAELFAQIDNIS